MRAALTCLVAICVAASGGCGRNRSAEPARVAPSPDPAAIRYRFTSVVLPGHDIASIIKGLEARLTDKTASPFDFADLGEAYLHRAQLGGDPDDYARAEAMAHKSLEQLPTGNGALLVLAKVANAKHEFRDAIRIATEYLTQKSSASAYVAIATAHLALGELDQAIEAAELAVSIKPDSSTHVMRALVLAAEGRDAEAGFDFAHAIELETDGDLQEAARMRALWGRFLLRRGELAGARVLFDEALRIAPDHALALAYRAELDLRTGKLAEARAGFERAFAQSRQVRYLIDLARAQELAGDLPAADSTRAQVEKIVRADLAERGVGHKLDLVEVLVDRGGAEQVTEAIALGREELTHRPSADTRFQLARALYRSGARDEAVVQVRAALATGVRDARLYELAARLDGSPRHALYVHEAERLDPGRSGWRALGMGK